MTAAPITCPACTEADDITVTCLECPAYTCMTCDHEWTAPAPIFLATTDTYHYTWRALGSTQAGAIAALLAGWHRHCVKTGADPSLVSADDVSWFEMSPDLCYRDDFTI